MDDNQRAPSVIIKTYIVRKDGRLLHKKYGEPSCVSLEGYGNVIIHAHTYLFQAASYTSRDPHDVSPYLLDGIMIKLSLCTRSKFEELCFI